jgi:DNA-binding MltR family transcriptional regulator
MDDSEQFISERFDLVMEFRHGLSLETDRGCALMAAEYLSAQLAELLQAHFVDDAKACKAALEDANGPVSTFSSRIEFTYLLGFIGPVARRELHLIRKIRNEFAHEYKPLAFENEAIAARCRELRAYTMFPDPSPRANFVRTVMGLLAVVHSQIAFAKHIEVPEDHLIEVSAEERKEVEERIRGLVKELMSGFTAAREDGRADESPGAKC